VQCATRWGGLEGEAQAVSRWREVGVDAEALKQSGWHMREKEEELEPVVHDYGGGGDGGRDAVAEHAQPVVHRLVVAAETDVVNTKPVSK
jgi:hypothetical protein